MGDVDKVGSFLKAMGYGRIAPDRRLRGGFPFVTISRETAAGGHELAQLLIRRIQAHASHPLFLGWELFDTATCEKFLKDRGLRVSTDLLRMEDYHSPLEDFVYQILGYHSAQEDVIQRTFSEIRWRATCGKVIVLGRGGACLTQDLQTGIRVRLIAPLEVRTRRLENRLHIPEPEARRITLERDEGRRRLIRHYFNRDISDPSLYHAIWNTEEIPIPEIADLVFRMIERRAGELPVPETPLPTEYSVCWN